MNGNLGLYISSNWWYDSGGGASYWGMRCWDRIPLRADCPAYPGEAAREAGPLIPRLSLGAVIRTYGGSWMYSTWLSVGCCACPDCREGGGIAPVLCMQHFSCSQLISFALLLSSKTMCSLQEEHELGAQLFDRCRDGLAMLIGKRGRHAEVIRGCPLHCDWGRLEI